MTFFNLTKKGFGFILLCLGLIVIGYTIYSSFNIFTAKTAPPQVFEMEEGVAQKSGLEGQMQDLIQEQLKGMLPADSIPTLFNLISWSIFAGILVFAGSQVSNIGIKLIK